MQVPEIDHLVFVAEDLEAGIDHLEALLGVRPALGGRHPDFGTHNALLSLGPDCYLELLAPDPTLPAPDRGRLTDVWGAQAGGLFTWVLRSPDIESLATASASPLGAVSPCSRLKPDGSWLSWKLSDPFVGRIGGAVPFLINWGESPHPAQSAPSGCTLQSLRVCHPEPERIRRTLDSLSFTLSVERAPIPALMAELETPKGRVVLS